MKNSISDPQWCIDNDWQVYIVPFELKKAKIAIRKGGITSHGINTKQVVNNLNKLRKRYEI